jgi:hypothetical protein
MKDCRMSCTYRDNQRRLDHKLQRTHYGVFGGLPRHEREPFPWRWIPRYAIGNRKWRAAAKVRRRRAERHAGGLFYLKPYPLDPPQRHGGYTALVTTILDPATMT